MRKNVDPKLTRRAQDVDEILEFEDEIEVDSALMEEHGITPLQLNNDDSLNAPISNIRSKSMSNPQMPKLSKSVTSRSSSRTSNTDRQPPTIVIGRGGAGNILSPSNSRKSANESKNKKKKKKWYSFLNVFS
ncbi:hypothetical protein Kpol_530p20 [Vanderwaltozyma polyspora DSM 70294]|uniref:Uncharacterized protein n=1 Tax=Vanderwaltozyma polyspora (strain ATCC 22028 / DSM 70294 / BCRC 21397 / CBS 2163 / NBRC 10782 / NRRL Y-8283 / UCD 57-17) TaxID=436907 RepID=A7TKZ4_VANPO|nr:uncharacterized protein Kpol_530p20 [Vanderwaltozyma polyspora DSM 70294]EDO17050.1 hypothetical protein Kpol_530p20 [Vanderwaltozyma polyspora DSM 70294]